ncbi:MAG TPA: toll/interleukin-1 receptor domain-containing protein [Thermoanaerobaculia bacterium]
MANYFLSYARTDSEFALRLANDLRAGGVDLWIDQRDIQPSQQWDRAIEAALRDCDAVVVVLSPRSVASDNVLDEVGFAIDHDKDVIPVLFEQCEVPIRITRLQRIDFTGNYPAALARCIAVLTEARRGGTKAALPPDLVRRAERDLESYIGPLAGELVEVDVMQARDTADFHRLVASHFLDPAGRAAFLKRAALDDVRCRPGAVPSAAFSQPLLDAVSLEVTKVLGPIPPYLVKEASRQASDSSGLYQCVASHVADTNERTMLLTRLQGL